MPTTRTPFLLIRYFVTPTYLQPLATALNNAGQPLPAVTDDINGVTRSTTTPDMGAYEFTPAANDAGVTCHCCANFAGYAGQPGGTGYAEKFWYCHAYFGYHWLERKQA